MKKAVVILAVSAILMAFVSGCGKSAKGQEGGRGGIDGMAEQNAVAISVKTQEAEPISIEEYTNISSKVSSESEVSVVPKVSGTAKNVYVSLGDTVKAGDILFEIDDTDEQIQLQQAQASLSSAQAGLESAQANYEKTTGGSYENEIQQLQSQVNTYQIQYDDLLTSLEQTKELYELGGASKQEVDDLQSSVDKAKLQLDTAKQQLELNSGVILDETIKSSQASVSQSSASVSQAQASLKSAQTSLENTKVRAEIDGTIGAVNISQGSMVSTATTAMTIVNSNDVKVSFGVSEKAINRVSAGSKAYITISAVSDEPFEVEVSNVSPSADSTTKLYTVEAYIDNTDGLIKPGMFANVKLVLEKHDNIISVPLNTVLEKNGEQYVFVVDENNIAHKTAVETGLKNEDYIEIVSGVNMGESIVVSGQDFLSDGSTVSIVES